MGFGAELKRLREGVNISANKLAKLIGVDAERLRKWEQKDMSPRDEDTALIEKFFGVAIQDVGKLSSLKEFLNVPKNAPPQMDYNAHLPQRDPGEVTAATIRDVARSLVIQSEAIKIQAEANRLTAENSRDILGITRSIEHVHLKMNEDLPASIVEKIAILGAGKFWKTRAEGLKELGTLLSEDIKAKQR